MDIQNRILHDPFVKHLIPFLRDRELCRFALTSLYLQDICKEELSKRAEHSRKWLKASSFLIFKLFPLNDLVNKTNLIINKCNHFEFLHYLPSKQPHPLAKEIVDSIEVNMDLIKKRGRFYSEFHVDPDVAPLVIK